MFVCSDLLTLFSILLKYLFAIFCVEKYFDFLFQFVNNIMGYSFSLGGLICSALGTVLTKKITKHFEKNVISLYLGISIGNFCSNCHIEKAWKLKWETPLNMYFTLNDFRFLWLAGNSDFQPNSSGCSPNVLPLDRGNHHCFPRRSSTGMSHR